MAKFFPQRQWFKPAGQPPVLYLTFDDGPTPEVTEWVLGQLAAFQAQATFFCIGKNIDAHPDIFSKLKAAGHSVGHHTQRHLKGWNSSLSDYLQDVKQAAHKVPDKLFRPPYGKMNSLQARKVLARGHQIIMWDVLSRDWDRNFSPEQCWQRVRKQARNGSIIVFHDSQKASENMKHALSQTLVHFSQRGYQFKGL